MFLYRYWHICKALQMFPSDPRFSYDKYNDMTKYRTTGELMEVSFQPRFKEGVPNGSSRMVIRKRDNYPMDREQNGIGSNLIPDQRNISGVSLGPSPAAWKAYLEKKKVISDRKRARDHIDTEEYSFNPRGGAFGQEDVPQPMEDQAPIEQPQNPIDQQQIQDPIEQSPDPPPTQSSRPSKKQSKTPKSSGMGLSSSYVPQSGQSASGIMGSVRASLLSSNDQGGGADTGDSST